MNYLSHQRANECVVHEHLGEVITTLKDGTRIGELVCKTCGVKVQCPSKEHDHD